ncbi:ABC transporter substrate-binding protein [Thalassobaculum fulvum]|jgi:phospholipid transport system substrate-binding protein|uniref:ABC transporter substrate-binding protein n=1 Tax=Thalassobaculum fulvum TaxID=1633335 RepID=A0A919CQH3_9PROT|nr:ABC transporter substrate-binding protein [Thalassobaculum fulvum]GHD54387.1 ABC transporter substrate-binding protein [Thalassobaculum fulvum]
MAFARVFAFVLLVLTAPVLARADAAAPEAFIHALADRALGLVTDKAADMEAKRARFDELLSDTFDMEGIGRFLLGRYWRLATPEEREAYLKAFKESIVYTYTARFDEYAGQKLVVDGSREDGQFTLVGSRIVDPNGNADVKVEWRLIRQGDDYRVVDVVIEGVSMSVTQRQEYASVIQSNGGEVKALIKALNERMARLKSSGS